MLGHAAGMPSLAAHLAPRLAREGNLAVALFRLDDGRWYYLAVQDRVIYSTSDVCVDSLDSVREEVHYLLATAAARGTQGLVLVHPPAADPAAELEGLLGLEPGDLPGNCVERPLQAFLEGPAPPVLQPLFRAPFRVTRRMWLAAAAVVALAGAGGFAWDYSDRAAVLADRQRRAAELAAADRQAQIAAVRAGLEHEVPRAPWAASGPGSLAADCVARIADLPVRVDRAAIEDAAVAVPAGTGVVDAAPLADGAPTALGRDRDDEAGSEGMRFYGLDAVYCTRAGIDAWWVPVIGGNRYDHARVHMGRPDAGPPRVREVPAEDSDLESAVLPSLRPEDAPPAAPAAPGGAVAAGIATLRAVVAGVPGALLQVGDLALGRQAGTDRAVWESRAWKLELDRPPPAAVLAALAGLPDVQVDRVGWAPYLGTGRRAPVWEVRGRVSVQHALYRRSLEWAEVRRRRAAAAAESGTGTGTGTGATVTGGGAG